MNRLFWKFGFLSCTLMFPFSPSPTSPDCGIDPQPFFLLVGEQPSGFITLLSNNSSIHCFSPVVTVYPQSTQRRFSCSHQWSRRAPQWDRTAGCVAHYPHRSNAPRRWVSALTCRAHSFAQATATMQASTAFLVPSTLP